MKRLIYLVSVICLLSLNAVGQTASVETGCVPLVVNFAAPAASSYYWDFGDGTSAVLQNPDHTFTDSGQYEVTLRNGQGGAVVGTLTITVYEDVNINIEASIESGCSPIAVDFTSAITVDPAVSLQGVSWSFGDGNSSTAINPTHIYTSSGTFSISLQVTTNESACDKTQIFTNVVTVEGIGNVGYSLDFNDVCEAPATVGINNNSFEGPGVTYFWDFGNGTTSTEYEPGTVTYDEAGSYEMDLTVTNSLGCSETYSETFTIAQYEADVSLPDTVCLGAPVQILNATTQVDSFYWLLPTASPNATGEKEPVVSFLSPGIQTFQMLSVIDDDCVLESTFQVFVEQANANFSISPASGCIDPQDIELTAEIQNYASYIWMDSIVGGTQFENEIVCPFRDSFYINTRDSVFMTLEVVSFAGCKDSVGIGYVNRKPDAHFVPSVTQGCAPLAVSFVDISQSLNGLENTFWDLGDGTTASNVQVLPHVYTQPGEYYAKLIVETSDGCRDTSAGRWIYVGEQIAPVYNISNTDICLNESVEISLLNDDPRIDGWHVYTDDGRTGHCFETTMTHQFITNPGVYDVEFSINYNGCFTETTVPEQITVNGANADIDYMINCETPYDIMMKNGGLNADVVTWQIDGVVISTVDSLTYTFPDRGEYLLTLTTEEDGSGCPADNSSVEIFITEPVARFEIAERICDNKAYGYDASASTDVNGDCGQGYLWKFPGNRPREVDSVVVNQTISISGPQEITLIVEDVHGCRDTTSRSTEVYGMSPVMIAETYNTCLPDNISFTSLSNADTAVVSWNWSFGANTPNPSVLFDDIDLDSLLFSLTIEDALGCTETIRDQIDFYKPFTEIEASDEPFVCLGEALTFTAEDYVEEGSFLNFSWRVNEIEMSTDQTYTHTFNELGTYVIELYYDEAQSGCNNRDSKLIYVLPLPEPYFESSLDDVAIICAPAQIVLEDLTEFPGFLEREWYIDGEGPFDGALSTFAFGQGTHTVDLVVTSTRGCVGTFSNSYTLVGPAADFTINPSLICVGEEVTFTLIDTANVSLWEWDFGDGVIVDGGDPVTHVFEFVPNSGSTNVSLNLFSADTGCEDVFTVPVEIVQPEALFEQIDSLAYCNGLAFFNNLSTDANEFTWSADGQVFSTDAAPRFEPGYSGTFEITLLASIVGKTCESEFTRNIRLDSVPPIVAMPNVFTPNGDGTNDFFNAVITDPDFEDIVNVTTFKIYNRWGKLIYDNDNPPVGWDGNFNSSEAPTEVYAYYIEYEIIGCSNKREKGNVTIIR